MNNVSEPLRNEYEDFLSEYNEPDLRHCNSTEADLRGHMTSIKDSHKGAWIRLYAAVDNCKKVILPKWLQ